MVKFFFLWKWFSVSHSDFLYQIADSGVPVYLFTCFAAVTCSSFIIVASEALCFSNQVFSHFVYTDQWVPVRLHKYMHTHISVPGSVTRWNNLPRLTSVRATHRTSATSAGKISALLITFPYFFWKGSIMVTYLFSLIGLAKKKPPGAGGKGFTSDSLSGNDESAHFQNIKVF